MKNFLYILMFIITINSLYTKQITITPIPVNTTKDDFNSNITHNGKQIYFTTDRRGGQKVYVAELNNGKWTAPILAKGTINDGDQIGSVSLTSDGQFMLFAATDHQVGGFGRTDIYSAEKVNGEWTNVKNLGSKINSDAWDSQPMISNDGNMLFFVSDRKGGYGGTDIYMSVKENGDWGKAFNLGSVINTENDEMTPVIGVDNINFTFSSNRPGGFGEMDIYVSKMKGKSFTKPENAGEPINTNADEFFYYSLPNSDKAYFSSSRSGGDGGLDIYIAEPNPFESEAVFLLNGVVSDAKSLKPLGANIVITNLETGEKVADLKSDDNTGEYYVILQEGQTYSITAEKDGYLFFSERYEVPKSKKGESKSKNINLSPISGGNTRLLVFFDFDKSTLKKESIPELERVVKFMKKNANVNISIEGHTDDVGAADYNDKLSDSRAAAVKTYITSKGIDAKRILTKGFGMRQPLVSDKTEEARATNRRVEMKILN